MANGSGDEASVAPAHPPTVPPGYPREYERRLELRDGRVVFARPILPADAPQLAAAIRTADPETLRRRFLGGPPPVTAALLTRLTALDYVRRFALVAGDEATGRGIAIARYEPLAEGVAEVAVVVDPAWRRVGLATALVGMLAEAALDRGVHTFSATYLAQNRSVAALVALADDAGPGLIREGIAEAAVALDRERVSAAIREYDADSDLPSGGRRATTGCSGDERGATRVSDQSVLGPDRIKHLEFIQTVVTRLGTNSFLIKGWALTIAAAIFAVLASRLEWGIALVGIVPVIAFWFLDGYFLWQERLFRRLYDDVRKPDSGVELMSMNTASYAGAVTLWRAVFSRTLEFFYGALLLVHVVLFVIAVTA